MEKDEIIASDNVAGSTSGRKPILSRLKTDKTFRKKFILTVWTFLAFLGYGLTSGQAGPSFPDLQLIINEDLATASWLNTACAVGFVAGSLIWGIICDRFDRVLVLFFTTFGAAITNGAVPWCSSFPLMIVMRALSCFFPCGLEIAGSTLILTMWEKEGAPYNQAVHFAFALGGIISPQIISPFLAPTTFDSLDDKLNVSRVNRTGDISYLVFYDYLGNEDLYNGTNSSFIVSSFNGQITYVHYGYIITSSIVLLCSIPLLVSFFKQKDKLAVSTKKNNVIPKDKYARKVPLKLKIPLLILLCLILHSYMGVEITYATYLMTFCLRHLKWSKTDGSTASSLYWIGFCFGRFMGIFMAGFFQSTTLILSFCIMIILSFFGLLLGSLFYVQPVVWVFIAVVGFAFSPIFPSVFSWTEERFFPVSGRVASLFMLSSSTGMAIVPIYLGYLMEHYNAMSFVYIMIGLSTFCLFICIVTLIFAKNFIPVGHTSIEVHVDSNYTVTQEMVCLNKINEFKDV
ncbi:hypothetical protein CHS0354_012187 [Potamilus streckersoni]|uniref:Uncharacterized protein n=1 Tax=Potamilus streckersoni TaxID=2493646 RepID=A0AAE0SB60_9BIVA|nr:hypothetical protein CHS0354_012187 [Potamilus streckersoni]